MKKDSNGDTMGKLRSPHSQLVVGNTVDWSNCDAQLLQKTVASASYKHIALRLGVTRDGGAYAVGVYAGEQYFTDYVRPGEDVDEYLAKLLQAIDEYDPGEQLPTGKQRAK